MTPQERRAKGKALREAAPRGDHGASGAFDDTIGEFAMEYADQNERDYRGFVTAAKEGRIEATADV